MRSRIFITRDDMVKLRHLIEISGGIRSKDRECIEALEEELDRAEIVDASRIPPNVVTMNSKIRLRDLDSGEERIYRLVFPNRSLQEENALSVLAPIGTALLGCRAGDLIEWPVPKGMRRLKVLEVLFQPEAAGVNA